MSQLVQLVEHEDRAVIVENARQSDLAALTAETAWLWRNSGDPSRHSLRIGGEIRRDRYNQFGNQKATGEFLFDGQATFNPANRGVFSAKSFTASACGLASPAYIGRKCSATYFPFASARRNFAPSAGALTVKSAGGSADALWTRGYQGLEWLQIGPVRIRQLDGAVTEDFIGEYGPV